MESVTRNLILVKPSSFRANESYPLLSQKRSVDRGAGVGAQLSNTIVCYLSEIDLGRECEELGTNHHCIPTIIVK